jgi:hypothetical protein
MTKPKYKSAGQLSVELIEHVLDTDYCHHCICNIVAVLAVANGVSVEYDCEKCNSHIRIGEKYADLSGFGCCGTQEGEG